MPYVPYRKGTLLIPSGPAGNPDTLHLFVIMNDKCADNRHLLLNLSTIRENAFHDPACVVRAGEHEFVRVGSYIDYYHARRDHEKHLIACVEKQYFFVRDPITEELYERIANGLMASRFASRTDKVYLARNGIVRN